MSPDPVRRLRRLLAKAVILDRAAKGNIQLLDPEEGTLRIVAHSGFEPGFLRHFEVVRPFDSSACGRAFGQGGCVIIPDVTLDAGFAPHREIARAAGFRSVKSMPVVGEDGVARGVLSTHCPGVRWDWERENTRGLCLELAAVLAALPRPGYGLGASAAARSAA
jgi:GAF domain-containing protein